jgi:SprT-like family protein
MSPSPARTVPGAARIFQRLFTRLGCRGRPPHFVVEFYPYADLSHTVRLREDTAFIRLSDLLSGAPLPVLEAAAAILLGRLYRRQPPRELMDAHRRFSYSRGTRRRLLKIRRQRARRIESRPRGACYDLAPLFDRLNRRYFRGKLPRPRLGWSARAWRSQLGCFDPALNQIVINRELDRKHVPECVVAYVLFHEMLHQKHPMRYARCRLQSHSAEFRREEKRFAQFDRAQKFLERF